MGNDVVAEAPKLLFFRWTKPGLAPFLAQHLDAQTRTLSHFFHVKVIDYDCDYGKVCDEFEPALTVFESGVYSGGRRITNTASRQDIPKLGFLHSDAYDIARAVFLSDMARWGVDQFFTTSVVMAEYTPEIADRLFAWPNAVDPQVFHDYGLRKSIPVLFTGSQERHYPWRNAISRILSERYATMTMPHFGWGGGTERMVLGEDYAMMLNASTFVPACGSMAGEVVRKQLEIPASMACLVTERTASLEALGFQDMVNCVFADATDVLEKLDYLGTNPDVLHSITKAGFSFVHSRHTEAHRSQVLDWLTLHTAGVSSHDIIQERPADPLVASSSLRGRPPTLIGDFRTAASDRRILERGWEQLRSGQAERAEHEFLRCLNYYFIPEAITGVVFASLAQGNSDAALAFVRHAMIEVLEERGAGDPDPVLWACLLRSLVCAGENAQAARDACRFPNLRHVELDRVRDVLSAILPGRCEGAGPGAPPRPSVMAPPPLEFNDWIEEFAAMLDCCGIPQSAAAIRQFFGLRTTRPSRYRTPSRVVKNVRKKLTREVRLRLKTGPVQRMRVALSPYKRRILSDDWSGILASIIRRHELDLAILIGRASRRHLSAVELGVRMNTSLPTLHRVDSWDQASTSGMLPSSGSRLLMVLNFGGGEKHSASVPKMAQWFKDTHFAATLVVIHGTATLGGYRLLSLLVESEKYTLLAHDNSGLSGRAILRSTAPSQGNRPSVSTL
ncbi:glycosyltransferase [Arthrobacter sp. BE255]|uniref:glycosyltransferase family protein n=1 Tax=Arthrobacter sp. BE255 TaxID=2817721 RepID=UPI002854444B|nr:glycosyltransferase [Arthrobacter sp. BE255]MDR7160370.1 hypothetical protein [Arthrobacter sp. BE255]